MDEKYIFAAIATIGAALITTGFASTKLIADKETKVSDFRLDWISSLREALSELLSEALLIVGRVKIAAQHSDGNVLSKEDTKKLESELLENWEKFRHGYYQLLLHFNFGETCFGLDENKRISDGHPTTLWHSLSNQNPHGATLYLDNRNKQRISVNSASPAAIELIRRVEEIRHLMECSYDDIPDNMDALQSKAIEATWLANLVIKAEWVRVKKGEKLFQALSWTSFIAVITGVFVVTYVVWEHFR